MGWWIDDFNNGHHNRIPIWFAFIHKEKQRAPNIYCYMFVRTYAVISAAAAVI